MSLKKNNSIKQSRYEDNFLADTYIHPTSEIHADAKIGKGTKIWNLAQLRKNSSVGKGCVIGKGVYVDYGVQIGNYVKIQNGVSIYRGVHLEDEVFIGPHAVFTNDLYPRANNEDWKITQTFVKKGASIGAGAIIICGNTIGNYAMVGAGAVVCGDVPAFSLVIGNPAFVKGYVCRCGQPHKLPKDLHSPVLLTCTNCEIPFKLNRAAIQILGQVCPKPSKKLPLLDPTQP